MTFVGALDVAAGLVWAGAAAVAWSRARRWSLAAAAVSLAWLVGSVVPTLAVAHRPVLLLAVLTFPHGRFTRIAGPRLAAGGVVLVGGLAWVVPVGGQAAVSVATAVVATIIAGLTVRRAEPWRAAESAVVARALAVLAAGLVLAPLLRVVGSPGLVETGLPLAAYVLAVLSCGLLVIEGLLSGYRTTDAVVEVAAPSTAVLLADLRAAAAEGRPGLAPAVALLEVNAGLQADLAHRVVEVRRSRARIVRAADEERRRLAEIVENGAGRHLAELDACLAELTDVPHGDRVAGLRAEIARTRAEVAALCHGLHPPILTERGLVAALEDLSARSALVVEVRGPGGRLSDAVETLLFYACAEALANVGKHAQASRATIEVDDDGRSVTACVTDDGRGGASLTENGGLAGLVDRLAVVGGSMDLRSEAGAGTSLTMTVPRS